MSAPEPTYLTHEPAPLYRNADNCEHIAPDEPAGEDDGSQEWLAYEAYLNDHPDSRDGDPICLLTPIGEFCPACTAYARDEGMCGDDVYIDIADCVYGPRGEAA